MRRAYQLLVEPIDRRLDAITSYRLVLYFLLTLVGGTTVLSLVAELPFEWYQLAASATWLIVICWSASSLFARFLNIFRNFESDFISALILSLLLQPADSGRDYAILAAAALAAMASKYLFTIGRRHIFNPAATGALAAGLLFDYYPSWWVGTAILAPLVVLGGLLVLRKMKRFLMVGIFIVTYLAILISKSVDQSAAGIWDIIWLAVVASPLLFFSTIMLTEPLTSPYRARHYIPYALLVAILYSPFPFNLAPEKALLLGNLFAYLLAPERRLKLKFTSKQKIADGIYSFFFKPDKSLPYQPGQFMEWTLPSYHSDSRGNRRYFTLASSPTEESLMVAVRLPDASSSFKKTLSSFKSGDEILASHLAGTFLMPSDKTEKLAFLAGGIGITPFRSMVKYLKDSGQERNITLLYSVNDPAELAFTPLFKRAEGLGLKTAYVISGSKKHPEGNSFKGPITAQLLSRAIPDYKDRLFYISGPYGFVQAMKTQLQQLGIPRRKINSDYFPGYG